MIPRKTDTLRVCYSFILNELINYGTSQYKSNLVPQELSDRIRQIGQNTPQGLIVKCQIFTLFKRYELYKDMKYKTLEAFVRKENNKSRLQLNKYVKIWENFEPQLIELYKTGDLKSTFGMVEKLYLLASIDEKEKINSWYNSIFDPGMTTDKLKSVLKEEHLLTEKPRKPKPKTNIKTEVKKLSGKLPAKLPIEDRQPIHDLIKDLRKKVNRNIKTYIDSDLNSNKNIKKVELSKAVLIVLYNVVVTAQSFNDDVGAGISKDTLELTEKIKKLII